MGGRGIIRYPGVVLGAVNVHTISFDFALDPFKFICGKHEHRDE